MSEDIAQPLKGSLSNSSAATKETRNNPLHIVGSTDTFGESQKFRMFKRATSLQ